MVATSLLPKVVSELGRRFRDATAAHGGGGATDRQQQPKATFGRNSSFASSAPIRFPNYDFQVRKSEMEAERIMEHGSLPTQVAHRLLALVMFLLPVLRQSALRACPPWAAATATAAGGADEGASPASSAAPSARVSLAGSAGSASGSAAHEGAMGREQADALFAAWAGSAQHKEWKTLQWVVQVRGSHSLSFAVEHEHFSESSLIHVLSMPIFPLCTAFGPRAD